MADAFSREELLSLIERELGGLHHHFLTKAKQIAHTLNPRLTDEDLLNPDNFTSLITDARYTYADGLAAGVLSAKMALRAALDGDAGL
jgi:hypothetical protein